MSEVILPSWWYADRVVVTGSGACLQVKGDRLYLRADGGPVSVVVSP